MTTITAPVAVTFIAWDDLLPVRNGYHSTAVNLLRELRRDGPVTCVLLKRAGAAWNTEETRQWCADHDIELCVVGMPHIRDAAGVLTQLWQGSRHLRTLCSALAASVSLESHVVLFTNGWDPVAPAIASLYPGAICMPADSISLFEERRTGGWFSRVLKPLRVALARWQERRLLNAPFAKVLYVSADDALCAEGLIGRGRCKVAIIPIGIDPQLFPLRDETEAAVCRLVFTGSMEYLPNRDAAERLRWQLTPQLPKGLWALVLAGRGGDRLTDLQGAGITIKGWVPSLLDELKRSDVFVAPMRMGAGAKNNVLHALALGLPVVGFPIAFAGFDTHVPGTVVCHDDAEMVKALTALIQDREARQRLGSVARAFVHQQCTWAQSGARLRQLLAESSA